MFAHGQYWTARTFYMRHDGIGRFVMFKSNKPAIDEIYDIHRK